MEAIDLVANQRRRVLVVTDGLGKKRRVFSGGRKCCGRRRGRRCSISPLLSLMRNQILAAESWGSARPTMHSENLHEMGGGSKSAGIQRSGCVADFAGAMANQKFLQELLPLIQGKIGMFVVVKRIVSRIGA